MNSTQPEYTTMPIRPRRDPNYLQKSYFASPQYQQYSKSSQGSKDAYKQVAKKPYPKKKAEQRKRDDANGLLAPEKEQEQEQEKVSGESIRFEQAANGTSDASDSSDADSSSDEDDGGGVAI
jgi:hypothetical protein